MSRVVLDLRAASAQHRIQLAAPCDLVPAARATWLGRMTNEYQSSFVFASLAGQAEDAGLAREDVEACAQFAREERLHGVLCGAVVESLGGHARAEVDAPHPVPRHEEVDRIECLLRNLLSVSCLSETIAVALIGAERTEVAEGPLHDLLGRIWADEIGHARFGWRVVRDHAPRLSLAARDRLTAYLAVAFAHVERHELAHLPLQRLPASGAALGLCDGTDARGLFYDTVEGVVVPQLEALGLGAAAAWRSRGGLSDAA